MIKLLHNENAQPSTFRTKNRVETNDQLRGTYNTNSEVKFKTTMLKLKLRNYSDTYVLVKTAITVARQGADAAGKEVDRNSRQVTFENCATTK